MSVPKATDLTFQPNPQHSDVFNLPSSQVNIGDSSADYSIRNTSFSAIMSPIDTANIPTAENVSPINSIFYDISINKNSPIMNLQSSKTVNSLFQQTVSQELLNYPRRRRSYRPQSRLDSGDELSESGGMPRNLSLISEYKFRRPSIEPRRAEMKLARRSADSSSIKKAMQILRTTSSPEQSPSSGIHLQSLSPPLQGYKGNPLIPKRASAFQAQSMRLSKAARQGLSDSSDEEQDRDVSIVLELTRVQRIFRRGLRAVYFIGVMVAHGNTVKLCGAMRPLAYYEAFEAIKPVVKREYLLPFRPKSRFIMIWNILMVILVTMVVMIVPVYVSFIDDGNILFQGIYQLFGVGFGCDILVNFLTAYYESDQRLITSFRKIALNYLQTFFFIDLLTIIPTDSLVNWALHADYTQSTDTRNLVRILRLSKLLRLYRMSKTFALIDVINFFSNVPVIRNLVKQINLNINVLKLFKLTVSYIAVNHIVGCFWFLAARLQDFGPDTWIFNVGLRDKETIVQYIGSVYWAFQMSTPVGYGDIAPTNTAERIICILWMIFCIGLYSLVLQAVFSTISCFDIRVEIFKDRINSFDVFATKVNLPAFLRQRIQRFYELNHRENIYHWMDSKGVMKQLPTTLKTSLMMYSYYSLIRNIPILQTNSIFTAELLPYIKLLNLQKGEILYREDDLASERTVKFVSETGKEIFSWHDGAYFGEIELLEDTKRRFFCQAAETTILLVCSKKEFIAVLTEFPVIEEEIWNTLELRKSKIGGKLMNVWKEKLLSQSQESTESQVKLDKMTDYIKKTIPIKAPKKIARRESLFPTFLRRITTVFSRANSIMSSSLVSADDEVSSPNKFSKQNSETGMTTESPILPKRNRFFHFRGVKLLKDIGDKREVVGSQQITSQFVTTEQSLVDGSNDNHKFEELKTDISSIHDLKKEPPDGSTPPYRRKSLFAGDRGSENILTTENECSSGGQIETNKYSLADLQLESPNAKPILSSGGSITKSIMLRKKFFYSNDLLSPIKEMYKEKEDSSSSSKVVNKARMFFNKEMT